MPTLTLFGASLTVTRRPSTVKLGGLSVTSALDDEDRALTLTLDGTVGPARLEDVAVILACTVQDDGILLAAGRNTALRGRLILAVGGPANGDDTPDVETLPAGNRIGIALVDRSNRARTALVSGRMGDLGAIMRLAIAPAWKRNLVLIDARAGDVTLKPDVAANDVPRLLLVDRFDSVPGNPPQRGIKAVQELRLQPIGAGLRKFWMAFRPVAGALFIHPDILDPTALPPDSANALRYQLALADGALAIDAEVDGEDWAIRRPRFEPPKGQPCRILALTLRDAHGHPLLLESETPLPLALRSGLGAVAAGPPTSVQWSATNRALVVWDTGADGSLDIDVRLASLDPIALYGRNRTGDTVGKPPYWLSNNGTVPVRPHPPRAIHGFARHAALAADGQPGSQPATLHLEAEVLPSLGLAFVKSEVRFAANGWRLEVEAAEQEVEARGPDRGISPVERRVALGQSGAAIRLPLIDANWAFANLTGADQVEADGTRRGDGVLAGRGAAWLGDLDAHWRTMAFGPPKLSDYQHVSGFRADPPLQAFATILAPPPAQARSGGDAAPAETAPVEVRLSTTAVTAGMPATADPTYFLFGGDGAPADLRQEHEAPLAGLGPAAERFLDFWCGVLPAEGAPDAWESARTALRGFLAGPLPLPLKPPGDWENDEDEMRAIWTLSRAIELAEANLPDKLGFDELAPLLAGMLPEEFAEWWASDPADPVMRCLIDYIQAPPSLEVLRRAVDAVHGERIAEELRGHLGVLGAVVTADLRDAARRWLRTNLPGFLVDLLQGLDDAMALAQQAWRDPQSGLDRLRRKYGPALTDDVYRALLDQAADAEELLDELRTLGVPLARLADLVGEPPEYLVLTRRFRRPARSGAGDDATAQHPVNTPGAALWNHRFDFCRLGTEKAWDFFLDADSTVIVKLGGRRGLDEVLREAEAAYRTPARPNPLGVPVPLAAGGSPADAMAALLAPDLLQPSWRGILVIAPTVDLTRDPVLATLTGAPHIAAQWAAVGGRMPTGFAKDVALDVWGRIAQTGREGGWEGGAEPPQSEAGWSLVRFEAVVRGTMVQSGDIAFRLDFRELLGRRDTTWKPVTVSATLPSASPEAVGKPRSFTFAASFDTPRVFSIDFAFLDTLLLRGVKIGSHNGDAVIDMDADLKLRQFRALGFDIVSGSQPLRLQDLRIRIPPLPDGRALAMGIRRALSFDLPAIRFPIVEERHLTLAGVEIRPTAVGLLRGKTAVEALFDRDLLTIKSPSFDNTDPATATFPYLMLSVDFGGTPVLGGGGSRLAMRALLGAVVKAGSGGPHDLGIGIAGLTGRDIRFDLFRLLTLVIGKVDARTLPSQEPDTGNAGPELGTLLLRDWDLLLLDKPLLPAGQKDFLMVQHPDGGERRGLLGWYAHNPIDSDFFRLHWLVLSRNLDLGSKVKSWLLERTGNGDGIGDERSVIGKILEPSAGGTPVLKAAVTKGEEWMFGVRFGLGELFTYGTLVLHDRHYYGIGLKAPWLEPVTGMEEIRFAYIPGPTPAEDRFRTSFRCSALDLVASMKSGEIALEWNAGWDFLVDIGYPWRGPGGYDWFRAFSIPVGVYEAKFGFFVEKSISVKPPEGQLPIPGKVFLTLAAGAGFYLGYQFETTFGIGWVRAGIGVFGILAGRAVLAMAEENRRDPAAVLKSSLVRLEVLGALGIFAYGEGAIEVWILSARFRVAAQASVTVALIYIPNARTYLDWRADLSASYSASVRVGGGWFSWTFSVEGSVAIEVSGRAVLGG